MSNNNQNINNEEVKDEKMTLDDAARVKVLSPARLVFKRFIRNKLAIFGICILLALFLFCFLGPFFYPYSETDVFHGWKEQNGDYAFSQYRTEYVTYWNPEHDTAFKDSLKAVVRNVNSTINKMKASTDSAEALRYKIQSADGMYYDLVQLSESSTDVYALTDSTFSCIATLERTGTMGVVNFQNGYADPGAGFAEAAADAIKSGSFEFNGATYTVAKKPGGNKFEYLVYTEVSAPAEPHYYFVSTPLTPSFNDEKDYYSYGEDAGFKFHSYVALFTGDTEFTYDGVTYTTGMLEDDPAIYKNGELCAFFSNFVATCKDKSALDLEFIRTLEDTIVEANKTGFSVGKEVSFTALSPKIENGKEVLDEKGEKVMVETEFTVKREENDYTVWRYDSTYVILIYQSPTAEHLLGTDAHGMDVLARIMYGGRISLLVGFIVVFIEMFLGVIMGGIAGYFGGWVDNLIMRLVDVFYCIPSMPILIITGALFDDLNMDHITRLAWMMAILGLLGWAGVARLVRGQILSLREQEFMVAAEASGLSTRRRIFSHLVPNVMPQLIVQATMGLGSVIITESTLSFLGLGVKHPLATWGNMMNNITQKVEYLSAYAYIWVPIGCMICFAVIAFNFVGDGLRDAFDPKMKR